MVLRLTRSYDLPRLMYGYWRRQLRGMGHVTPWSLRMHTNLAIAVYISLVGSGLNW